MHNFKELKVWQKGIQLAKEIYLLTETFPSNERFGLISQIRRSAVSIPSNIAEGCGRRTNKDFSHFLSIFLGSSFELETQLILSQEVGFVQEENTSNILTEINEIQKMTRTLIDKFSKV